MPKTSETEELQKLIDILPQKHPFVMIDEIIEFKEGESLTAVKNITGNEWVFEGVNAHINKFPETLIMEGAAQTALALFNANEDIEGNKSFLLGKTKAEFFNVVKIGDVIKFKTLDYKSMGKSGYINVDCFVDEQRIAKIQIFYSLLD